MASGADTGADGAAGPEADPRGLVLVVGDDEYLVSRAIEQVTAAHRRRDPAADIVERAAAGLESGELYELLSPSLFGGGRTVVLYGAQDVPAAMVNVVSGFFADPGADITLVLQHVGGAKGRGLLQAARQSAAAVFVCAKLTRAGEREDFVRTEVRRHGATVTADAVRQLIEAVGTDLRELAAVAAQLAADSGGRVDARVVAAYHRGRALANGYAVADRAIVGDTAGAVENLRWALSTGVAPVLIADALADGVRTVAKVLGAGRGGGPASPDALASSLGMPPWKIRRAQQQTRGWTESGLSRAMVLVADLNADVKGEAADPEYALERAVRTLVATRGAGR